MFIFNQLKKNLFIYLIAFLGISQFAYGNSEISAHFGKKFQTDGAWHLGVDALYRMSINENSSFGIGPRYQFHLKDAGSGSDSRRVDDVTISASTSGKYNNHRLSLLTNYRYEMMKSLFVGGVFSIDVWKNLSADVSASASLGGRSATINDIRSSEFLWNKFTGQIGVEVGYKVTPNFLIKLEGGYDLLSFKECSTSISVDGNEVDDDDSKFDCAPLGKAFDGVYATVGLGYHF